MPMVNLTDEEWRTVMAVLAKGPWDVVNSLLMQMGDQLRTQASGRQYSGPPASVSPIGPIAPRKKDSNKEKPHEQQ